MRALALAVALSAASVLPAQAGDTPTAQMNFLQGCWRGVFANNAALTDTRCFEPMQGGVYVRDTHVIHGGPGPYGGESIYYLDAQAHKLAVIYFASDGGIERGFAEPDGRGGLSFPPGVYVDADGSTLTLRATWRADGPDRYVATSEIQENGHWREHLHITYTRAPEMTAPAR